MFQKNCAAIGCMINDAPNWIVPRLCRRAAAEGCLPPRRIRYSLISARRRTFLRLVFDTAAFLGCTLWLPFSLRAQPFQLPTANHALYEKGGEERFFVGTVGKPWTTRTFGCV